MAERRLGIIFNGATGELAKRQHLPALLAIRREGGLLLANGDRVVPDPILVGRSAERLEQVARDTGIERWTTDFESALASPADTLFFDAAVSGARFETVQRAIAAGKHIYCEKPISRNLEQGMALVAAAERACVKNGTVQDKLFLPGFAALMDLRRSGFFGRVLEVRIEMGRWVFDGAMHSGQRPSWNYRKRDGGGLILDMFPHWRYMLDHLAGEVTAVEATCRTHIPRRWDESGQPYDVDVEDSVFAHVELDGSVVASVNSSWCTRVRRDASIQVQIDGIEGSAVAGPFDCWTQSAADTPTTPITAALPTTRSFYDDWTRVSTTASMNSYRAGWELFIRHLEEDTPFPYPLLEGVKGIQLAELAYRSSRERRWIAIPRLLAPSGHAGA
jgi:predicted dehydrogenase